ncbi:MAG: hypothetical protein PHO73_03525 [Atribacterota bacterium]|nr:hypothetical protein [Atribacterota bacterium]
MGVKYYKGSRNMDPYANGLIDKNPFGAKRIIQSSVVAILQLELKGRGLKLIQPRSRVLKKNELHELIVTDEKVAKPGETVNNVAYIAFIEILKGGVMVVGDKVYWNNNLLGIVAGFDDTHMPNHQNIILYSPKISTGKKLNIRLEDKIIIHS